MKPIKDFNKAFEYAVSKKQCDIHVVVSTLVCDIEKGTRCKDSFPDYKDGKCRICGGQAN
jgi:hypothetical protein